MIGAAIIVKPSSSPSLSKFTIAKTPLSGASTVFVLSLNLSQRMAPGRDPKRQDSDISASSAESTEYHGVHGSDIDVQACGSASELSSLQGTLEDDSSDDGRTIQFRVFKVGVQSRNVQWLTNFHDRKACGRLVNVSTFVEASTARRWMSSRTVAIQH